MDKGTIVLIILAILLLGMIIILAIWGNMIFVGKNAENSLPVIEHVVTNPENTVKENIETKIKLDTPPVRNTVTERTDEIPDLDSEQIVKARLFYIRVSDEGIISIKSILRDVHDTKAPMTTAINALLLGPTPAEINNDLHSLIPEGTKLLGARVENGIAFLDFNEIFRFNSLGLEGYRAQTEQIVFTVTEFPTVEKIQFLIEGQRVDYLGGEGFWVGSPLGRNDYIND